MKVHDPVHLSTVLSASRCGHPWTQAPGWVGLSITAQSRSALFEETVEATKLGWRLWISSDDRPAAFMYRPLPGTVDIDD